MSTSSNQPPTPQRREFLAQIATATAALAGTACAGSAAVTPAAPSPVTDGWTARITGKHRAVFDAPEIADGVVVTNAWVYRNSYATVYGLGDADLTTVLVLRHHGIPMALDDTLWAKYDLGQQAKVEDPDTKTWARRNIYWKPASAGAPGGEFTLDALHERGAILIGCALAARRLASEIAKRTSQRAEDVHAEVRAHLITGLELAPSGIFAVTRAQEAGCTFIRST